MDYKNILIFRIGHLGDTLVTLPTFWAIKKAFPEANLTLLANGNPQTPNYVLARNILPEKGLFDDWIIYPSGENRKHRIRDSARLLFDLRKKRFDAVFYLMTRNRTLRQIKRDRLFFRLAGISKIIGEKYLLQNLLDFKSPRPLTKIEKESEFFLNCLKTENVPIPPKELLKAELSLSKQERNYAHVWLSERCGKGGEKTELVAVAPASKWESKIWAEERFYEVIEKLVKERGVFPIIFGGPEDKEKGERLLQKWRTGANAAGELNIRQAAAALEKCKIFVGNDSGTMHLAASVGTPCVGIFSSIDWLGRWEPFGDKNIILRTEIECEGCHLAVCPRNNECLHKITSRCVLDACLKLLDDV